MTGGLVSNRKHLQKLSSLWCEIFSESWVLLPVTKLAAWSVPKSGVSLTKSRKCYKTAELLCLHVIIIISSDAVSYWPFHPSQKNCPLQWTYTATKFSWKLIASSVSKFTLSICGKPTMRYWWHIMLAPQVWLDKVDAGNTQSRLRL